MLTDTDIQKVCDKVESERTNWSGPCRELVLNIGFEVDVNSEAFEDAVKGASWHFLRNHRAEITYVDQALKFVSAPDREHQLELHRWFVLVLAFQVRNTAGQAAAGRASKKAYDKVLAHVEAEVLRIDSVDEWHLELDDAEPDVVLRCLAGVLSKHLANAV